MSRILYLNDVDGRLGGGEYQLIRLAVGARAAGVDFEVACMPGSPLEAKLREVGVPTHPLAALRRNPVWAVFALRRLCREIGADIIHTSSFLTNFSGRAAGGLTGVPVVTTYQCEPDAYLLAAGGGKRRLIFAIRDFIDRGMAGYTTLHIAVSTAVKRKLVERGDPESRIVVIPNGVDAGSMRAAAGEEAVGAPSPAEGIVTVGTLGRLDPVKGLDTFIEAVDLLVKSGTAVRAYIIGDGAEMGRLQALASERGLADKVIFTGYMENPYPFLAALDIYLVTSKSEGQNITILSAMVLEKPVVATRVGGILDMVADETSGLLVEPGDGGAVAGAVTRLAGDAALRARIVAGGRAVADGFTETEMVARTLDVYRQVVQALLF